MKKVLIVLALSLFAVGAFAQKGKFYIGTSVMSPVSPAANIDDYFGSFATGFLYNKVKDDSKSTIWGLAPEVGYFVSDKFSVGLGVAFNQLSTKDDEEGAETNKVNSFGINPYVRYYACTADKFSFYVQGGFEFVSSKADAEGAKAANNFGVNIRPGVQYSLSDKFAINATFGELGFSSGKNYHYGAGDPVEVKETNFGLNLSMATLLFGITYSF